MRSQKVKNFLSNKKILILDQSSTSRNLVEKALNLLGADKSRISSMKNFDHAIDYVRIHKPEIIITDFQIHNRFGLDLVTFQNEYQDNPQKRIFMVTTDNAKDSAVADAAEEDVDGYILKPFTIDSLTTYLLNIISKKINPDQYQQLIVKGKNLLETKRFNEAISYFEKARDLNLKPSLAYFYLGEVFRKQNKINKALEFYRKGQTFSRMHFRCVVGEFLCLFHSKEFELAYTLMQNIAKVYPLSPQLLKHAFSLCVLTYRFEEVELYYDTFLRLERKTNELKKVVSQTLLQAGKSLLQEGAKQEAIDYFLKGSVIRGKTPAYLHEVIDYLVDNDFHSEAESYLAMFEPEEIGVNTYRQLIFKMNSKKFPSERLLEEGKSLIDEGAASPEVYTQIFDLLKSSQHKDLLESLVCKAIDQFPERKGHFLTYFPA